MILSSSVLSLPKPLCRDALWRERGAVSDRARSVPRDGLPTVSGRTRTRGVLGSLQLRARAEYSSLMRSASGDAGHADAGFDDGRVGRTSVPWVAREYLADAGTNATRGNRAELSGSRDSSFPSVQKKNLERRDESSHHTHLQNLRIFLLPKASANLESQTPPRPRRSSFRVCKRRTGQSACDLAPRRGDARRVSAARKQGRPHSSRGSRTSTDTRELDARGERVEASEPTLSPPGTCRTRPIRFSRQSPRLWNARPSGELRADR